MRILYWMSLDPAYHIPIAVAIGVGISAAILKNRIMDGTRMITRGAAVRRKRHQ